MGYFVENLIHLDLVTSDDVIDSKLTQQTFTSEFESQWELHSYDLVLHLSKRLDKSLIQLDFSKDIMNK